MRANLKKNHKAELMVHIGETRRLKREPNLEAELREAADEFHLSGFSADGLATAEDRAMAAGHSDPLVFDGWAEADADALGVIADTICGVVPQARNEQRKTAISWATCFGFFVFLNLIASADLEWPLVIDRNCNWPYSSAGHGSLPGWAIALMAIQSLVLLVLLVGLFCLPCSPLHRWLACKSRAIFGRRACDDVEQQQKGGHSLENNLLAEDSASK